MNGKLTHIFMAANQGQAMKQLRSVEIEAGKGIVGDRYAEGRGAFSGTGQKIRHISLIDLDDIILANLNHGTSFTPAQTRRNLVTRDVELPDLIGREFQIGAVQMIGRSLCDPCARPANLIKSDQDFTKAFENSGGLRAEVLHSGVIAVGAVITY